MGLAKVSVRILEWVSSLPPELRSLQKEFLEKIKLVAGKVVKIDPNPNARFETRSKKNGAVRSFTKVFPVEKGLRWRTSIPVANEFLEEIEESENEWNKTRRRRQRQLVA